MDNETITIATQNTAIESFDEPLRQKAASSAIPLYHAGKVCDECGCQNFWVREFTAECGNCNAAYQIKQ